MWDRKPFPGQERRKFKRVEKFFIVSARTLEDSPSEWTLVNLENISEGGVLFNHTESFEKGTLVDLKIKILPDRRPVQCVGKVIRGQKLGHLRIYESAVQFTEVKPEDRVLIRESLKGASALDLTTGTG